MPNMAQGKMTVADSEIVNYMSKHTDPAFTTAEIAEHFDMTDVGIRNRLNDLYNSDVIKRKKPSERTVIWWHPDAEAQLRLSE